MLALDAVDVPVVHDVHDMQSLRRTPYEDGFPEPADPLGLERRAVEGCAALVTISPELVAELEARYRLPRCVVAYANYALARDLRSAASTRPLDGPPRLVYQGTLSTNGGHYDLRELFAAIAEQGVSLDVYMARVVPEYRDIPGIRVHDPLPADELLRELVHYDFGWAGFNASLNGAHLDTALPNKLYEYLGCGLPVLTLRHRALRRMLREEGVGIALDDVRDLAAALTSVDAAALRARVAERRSATRSRARSRGSRRSTRTCWARSRGGPEVRDGVAAVGPPGLGELDGSPRVGAERGEAVLDAQVGREEGVVVARAQRDVGGGPRPHAGEMLAERIGGRHADQRPRTGARHRQRLRVQRRQRLRRREAVGDAAAGSASGSPAAATSRPASVRAAATEICWPSSARTASSAGSGCPGMRRPGAARTSGPSRWSSPRRARIASGSASRRRMARAARSSPATCTCARAGAG